MLWTDLYKLAISSATCSSYTDMSQPWELRPHYSTLMACCCTSYLVLILDHFHISCTIHTQPIFKSFISKNHTEAYISYHCDFPHLQNMMAAHCPNWHTVMGNADTLPLHSHLWHINMIQPHFNLFHRWRAVYPCKPNTPHFKRKHGYLDMPSFQHSLIFKHNSYNCNIDAKLNLTTKPQ